LFTPFVTLFEGMTTLLDGKIWIVQCFLVLLAVLKRP
jgi:hypothetical protein